MAIAFRCTGCGHAFRVHDHLTGKRIKCAQCGASLVVPSESTHESQNVTWNDSAAERRGPTPVAAAASAPPRPPVQTSGYFAPVEGACSSPAEVADATAGHEIRRRRRRGMPLYGWLVMLLGLAACVVLAVMALESDAFRLRGNRAGNDRALSESKSSLDAVSPKQIETVTVERPQPASPAASDAGLDAAGTSGGQGQIDETLADQGESKSKPAAADGEVRANQPIVVRRTTRFRDESDQESFVHDRTEGRFLKFEEGMARVSLEIRIGDEVTGRVPAHDLDFGRPVDLDDVDAVRALKTAGAKLTSDRIGYVERLECPFKMTDELMEHAAKLPRLVAINANFSGLSDAGLAHLEGHKRLKELLLSQTSITDAGLAHLATIATLEKIDLEETKITDAGLAHLFVLDKLQQIALRKTAVTEKGVADLKKNRSPRSVKF